MFGSYPCAMALTLLIEVPIVLLLTPAEKRRALVPVALLLNGFSHPLATLCHWEGLAPLAAIEGVVFLVEFIGYRLAGRMGWGRALACSALANGVTAGLTLLL